MKASTAFVEFVSARPDKGAVGAFAFGRSPGSNRSRLWCGRRSVSFLTPAHWKRLVSIRRGRKGAKDATRSEAIRRWPAHAALFARVKDDGHAESALIAVAELSGKAVDNDADCPNCCRYLHPTRMARCSQRSAHPIGARL